MGVFYPAVFWRASRVPVQKSRLKRWIVRTGVFLWSSTADAEARSRKYVSDKTEMKHVKCFLPWIIVNINNGGQHFICCTDLAVQKSLETCNHYSLVRFQRQSRTDRYCLNIVTEPTKGKLGMFLCDQRPTQISQKVKQNNSFRCQQQRGNYWIVTPKMQSK